MQEMYYDHLLKEGKASPLILRRLAASFRQDEQTLRPIFETIVEFGYGLMQQLANLQQPSSQEGNQVQL